MSTSYADSAQAREWDKRFDDWGRPKAPKEDDFHDYEAAALALSEAQAVRAALQLQERKAAAKRINAAVEQIGDFFGMNGDKT